MPRLLAYVLLLAGTVRGCDVGDAAAVAKLVRGCASLDGSGLMKQCLLTGPSDEASKLCTCLLDLDRRTEDGLLCMVRPHQYPCTPHPAGPAVCRVQCAARVHVAAKPRPPQLILPAGGCTPRAPSLVSTVRGRVRGPRPPTPNLQHPPPTVRPRKLTSPPPPPVALLLTRCCRLAGRVRRTGHSGVRGRGARRL